VNAGILTLIFFKPPRGSFRTPGSSCFDIFRKLQCIRESALQLLCGVDPEVMI
jgi:hypothetical protein